MSEQPVFWLGGKPGGAKKNEPTAPEAERFEPAIRDACVTCGYELDEYVAAQGGFGGWLAHLKRDGKQYRLFWSGKNGRISFEQSHGNGGWNELASADLGDAGLPGSIASIRELLPDGQVDSR